MSSFPGLSLHHVGYATPAIAPLTERYVQRYGYQISTPVIHDPFQTAFVQFLLLPGDNVYLELIAPDGPDSRLASIVRKGGGLHHLCYRASYFETVIPELEKQEMMLITEPHPAVAFASRRICWLLGKDPLPIELIERADAGDLCVPAEEGAAL